MMKSPPIFAISAGDSRRPEFIQSFVMDSIPCTMKEQKRSCSRLSAVQVRSRNLLMYWFLSVSKRRCWNSMSLFRQMSARYTSALS